MHPLLPQVGHLGDRSALPFEERRPLRRGAPEALRFEAHSTGWPPMLIAPAPAPRPLRPQGAGWGWLARLWRRGADRTGPSPGPLPAPLR